MRRKNKKRTRTFGIYLTIEKKLLDNLQQVDMLCNDIKKKLIKDIRAKGYAPTTDNIRLLPLNDLEANNTYMMKIRAVYVGKRKALEGVINES